MQTLVSDSLFTLRAFTLVVCGIGLLLLFLSGCDDNTLPKQRTINSLPVYQHATKVLIDNAGFVDSTLNEIEEKFRWRSWSRFYFNNSVCLDSCHLRALDTLWASGYIASNSVSGGLTFRKDSTVKFVTFVDKGNFSSYVHEVVYSKSEYAFSPYQNIKLIDQKKLTDNWTYFVYQEFYLD